MKACSNRTDRPSNATPAWRRTPRRAGTASSATSWPTMPGRSSSCRHPSRSRCARVAGTRRRGGRTVRPGRVGRRAGGVPLAGRVRAWRRACRQSRVGRPCSSGDRPRTLNWCAAAEPPCRCRRSSRSVPSSANTASSTSASLPLTSCSRPVGAIHQRIDAGLHDGMGFTFRNPERSTDPSRAVAEARSVIVAARSYLTDDEPDTGAGQDPHRRRRRALRLGRPLRAAACRTARRRQVDSASGRARRRVRRRQLDGRP